ALDMSNQRLIIQLGEQRQIDFIGQHQLVELGFDQQKLLVIEVALQRQIDVRSWSMGAHCAGSVEYRLLDIWVALQDANDAAGVPYPVCLGTSITIAHAW